MSIADRIAANRNQPAEPKPSVTNGSTQPDQFWKSVKGPGVLHRLVSDENCNAIWDYLASDGWGCLAMNVVGSISSLDEDMLNLFPAVIARNVRSNGALTGEIIKNWSFDYGNAQGCWVKLVDGSVIHFQQVQSGVHVSAWLYQVFGGNNGGAQVTLDQSIVSHTIVGLGVSDVRELITEALGAL